jgi:hypothetical protein
VTIGDTEAPVISCAANQTVNLAVGSCTYEISGSSWDATAADNCLVDRLSYVLSGASSGSGEGSLSGVVLSTGSTTISWQAEDAAGNTASCSLVVLVRDEAGPQLSCRPSAEITFNGQPSISIDPVALASSAVDACGEISLSASLSSVSCAQLGQSLPVTVTATDAQGNSSSCQTVVSVTGLPCQWTAPVDGINCQGESSVSYDAAAATYTLYVDNCQQAPPANVDELSYAYLSLCGNRSYIEARIDSI